MTNDQLIADLRARLEEAEETLRAIREGEVDAVVVTGSKGDRVFALTESESLPRLMVETMNEAGLAVTPEGLLVFANDRAAAFLGRPKDQLLGHDLAEFVAPADADRFRQLLQNAATTDARIEFVGATGNPVPMHVWASHLDRADGPLICLVATDLSRVEADRVLIAQLQKQTEQLRAARAASINLMKDAVLARQQAEQVGAALAESEQRIQQALRVSHSFTFEWHSATDTVLRSASCGMILGLTGDEAVNDIGQRFFQRVHPDDRVRFTQMLGKLTPAAASYTTEYRVVRPDGSTVVLEEVGQATFDVAGKLQRLVGVTTDITIRKQAEEELRKLTEQMRLRTADLESTNEDLTRLNKAMVGRELRMIELKKQVNELCAKAGLPKKYKLEF
jgi:PAS domain S-box-containing protein